MLLTKGFEVELYTGTPTGDVVGIARDIVRDLAEFVYEPDHRNVEYTTPPRRDYGELLEAVLEPRLRLREYLRARGNLTLHPGSTMALGGSDRFERSDPGNPYHTYIEQTYGTKVVTASIHINFGIDDPEALMRAYRVLRLEAPLVLALTAASPFLNGRPTGWHSTRWGIFPQTPAQVPLFASHQHYIDWTEAQLALGTMQNVRHLWLSVRPNGENRPYDLNRLELRISDLVSDPIALLAVTALLELRIQAVLQDESIDPLRRSPFSAEALEAVAAANETAAARDSLDATLTHWQSGEQTTARDWIQTLYEFYSPAASQLGIDAYLRPLTDILTQGNEAQRWLNAYRLGMTPRQIMTAAIQDFNYKDMLALGIVAAA
ncbi:glutamate--cysteine ligase [Nodosilinea nodulosa]|uniref:glutamate--cysteine ligase n=1 Tax=Nodosilinea nodulosa TaxID=416001 RepID=UPI0002E5C1F8|nr:glutamate--cysteine ligase [Nodosilinea nodulosa]